mmetsp:Transcript_22745/g.65550  ORF Transcript_22745/g.65550 Transcript_22745/m.65550 type:complete len:232 (+) Transcript_22745:896-1591(+)
MEALRIQVHQVSHRGSHLAQERGEGDQGNQNHATCEHPLLQVRGSQVLCRRRKLRKRPMEGGGVRVRERCVAQALAPRALAAVLFGASEAEPCACDEMVQRKDAADEAGYAEHHQGPFGVDRIRHPSEDLQQPPKPHQAEEPQRSQKPRAFDEPQEQHRHLQGQQGGRDEVDENDREVHHEPRTQISERHPARLHLHDHVPVEASHEIDENVHGPKCEGGPLPEGKLGGEG